MLTVTIKYIHTHIQSCDRDRDRDGHVTVIVTVTCLLGILKKIALLQSQKPTSLFLPTFILSWSGTTAADVTASSSSKSFGFLQHPMQMPSLRRAYVAVKAGKSISACRRNSSAAVIKGTGLNEMKPGVGQEACGDPCAICVCVCAHVRGNVIFVICTFMRVYDMNA